MTPSITIENDAGLRVSDISLTRGGRFLWRDLSFSAEPGSAVAVVGPNGSGKSSLLACLTGLLRATTGSVEFDGMVVGEQPTRNRRRFLRDVCGVLLQDGNVVPEWTVTQNVDVVRPTGVSASERRDRALAAMTAMALDHQADVRASALSGGEQQRLAVARLLTQRPALVVADEPTSALDTAGTVRVLDAFDTLRASGSIVVVATHDPAVVRWSTSGVDLAMATRTSVGVGV